MDTLLNHPSSWKLSQEQAGNLSIMAQNSSPEIFNKFLSHPIMGYKVKNFAASIDNPNFSVHALLISKRLDSAVKSLEETKNETSIFLIYQDRIQELKNEFKKNLPFYVVPFGAHPDLFIQITQTIETYCEELKSLNSKEDIISSWGKLSEKILKIETQFSHVIESKTGLFSSSLSQGLKINLSEILNKYTALDKTSPRKTT